LLVHAAFGQDVRWQRLVSVLLHAGTGIALFAFLYRLFRATLADAGSGLLAFFGALWFVLHPVSVYGVAYVIQRSIILATLFSLVSLSCVLEGLLQRRPAWYG